MIKEKWYILLEPKWAEETILFCSIDKLEWDTTWAYGFCSMYDA